MNPSEKDPSLDKALTSIFGVDRRTSITRNICVACGQPALKFSDEISRKEFSISGLCDDCQKEIFE